MGIAAAAIVFNTFNSRSHIVTTTTSSHRSNTCAYLGLNDAAAAGDPLYATCPCIYLLAYSPGMVEIITRISQTAMTDLEATAQQPPLHSIPSLSVPAVCALEQLN